MCGIVQRIMMDHTVVIHPPGEPPQPPSPGDPIPDGGLCELIGAVYPGAENEQDMLDAVTPSCCTLYMIGHRGGGENEGGIVTYPGGGSKKDIIIGYGSIWDQIGSWGLGARLRNKFFGRGCPCKDCVIHLVTCGGDNVQQGDVWRAQLANDTGCTVCGSKKWINFSGDFLINSPYPGKSQYEPHCVKPGNMGVVAPWESLPVAHPY